MLLLSGVVREVKDQYQMVSVLYIRIYKNYKEYK